MKYRTYGKTGKKISLLSFGGSKVPEDEQEAAGLVSAAVDAGINYFETAPNYGEGTCERKIGLGVRGRRDQVYLSSKSLIKPETDGDAIRRSVEGSLRAMQTDSLDFFHFWAFRWDRFDLACKKGGALEAVRKLQDEGVIHHFGVTSHDTAGNVIKLIETGEFEGVTVHYHILTTEKEDMIAVAKERGLGVAIMSPIAGGVLANPSKNVLDLFSGQHQSAASADLALRFVWSCEGVTTAACTMDNVNQLNENVAAAERFKPLDDTDREHVLAVNNEFSALGHTFCTGCGYCWPCASGVWVVGIFRLLNYTRLYGLHEQARKKYYEFGPTARASACTECGECEPRCPHGIPIMAQLKEALELFEGDQ